MPTIQEINTSIVSGQFTNDELTSITQAVTFARAQLAKKNVWNFRAGAKVKFTSSRSGQLVVGEITKVNRKFIIVRSGVTNWRVPANMLEAV